MAVYGWPPDLRPSSMSFFLEANAATSVSPLSRAVQVLNRPGARWVCRMEFRNRDFRLAPRLDALLARLEGPVHEVAIFDFRRPLPRGTAGTAGAGTDFTDGTAFTDGTMFAEYTSDPVVAVAASANAEVVYTEGWATSEPVLMAGDYVGLGGRLHMVLDDVQSDGSGDATLRVRPRLRGALSPGTRVVFVRPTARFRLTENGIDNRSEPGPLSSYSLSFVESLP